MHIYDVETYPNVFTFGIKPYLKDGYVFEISDRINEYQHIRNYLLCVHEMVGFNNFYFDWPVTNLLLQGCDDPLLLYKKANDIITGEKFQHAIWEPEKTQIDLYLIHHFDNMARATSLKMIQFNMRLNNIQELPYEPGTYLTNEQIDQLKIYNYHYDVKSTEEFTTYSMKAIEFRRQLDTRALCHSDAKIGKKYFIRRLKKHGIDFSKKINGKPTQTSYPDGVKLKDIIFPYVKFNSEIFKRNLEWMKQQTIINTKGDLETTLTLPRDFKLTLGTGGIHGSVHKQRISSSKTYRLLDLDVTSYYPSLAIVNRLYPAHLGEIFFTTYGNLKDQRLLYEKGTAENLMLKLALNAVFGDSGNKHSEFLDPGFLLSITINGQLLLCMLAEWLMYVPELELIQLNTDGLTIYYPRKYDEQVKSIYNQWEKYTCLDLEQVYFSRMFIRDVNNYIAEFLNGDTKNKGAYKYDYEKSGEWHKNFSQLVVKKITEKHMLTGGNITDLLKSHNDPWDFMLRAKVNRNSKLVLGENNKELQRITRYYISNNGEELFKIMPPLAGKTENRRNAINKGFKVTPCNYYDGSLLRDLNYDYYEQEIRKLVI